MRYRTLGKTGLEVSELGFGAWGIGGTMWIGADDDESLRALRLAIERGVNFIDTAYGYGDGHSEELVGAAVRESAETVYVATKIPPKNRQWPARPGVRAEEAFPADWIVECTERSLQNLGLETIDVQQFHVWSDEWVGQGDWLDGDRAAQARREDPVLRRLDQRPPAGERGPARRVRARRHRAGDLQRLRPEPRGRALPRRRGGATSA